MTFHRISCAWAFAIALSGVATAAGASPVLYSVQSNGDDHLYSIDAATGVATDLGRLAFDDAEGLAFAGSTLYAIGGSTHELWNITTPPGVLVGATGTRNGIDAGLDFDERSGTMYNFNGGRGSSNQGSSSLYTVNLATGAATLVGSNGVYGDGFAVGPTGSAYAIDGNFTDSLYGIDLLTGAASLIGNLGLGNISVQFGLTFGDDGALYGLDFNGSLYRLNTSTGAATLVATTTCGGNVCGGWEGLAALQGPAGVPEPGSLALAMLGLGLAGAATRRRAAAR